MLLENSHQRNHGFHVDKPNVMPHEGWCLRKRNSSMSLWNAQEAFGVKQNEEVFGNTQNCFAHLFGIRTRPSRWKGVLFLFRWFPKTDVQSTSYKVVETIQSRKFSKLRRDMFAIQHMRKCTCPHMTVITRHAKVHQIATEHNKCILSRI